MKKRGKQSPDVAPIPESVAVELWNNYGIPFTQAAVGGVALKAVTSPELISKTPEPIEPLPQVPWD